MKMKQKFLLFIPIIIVSCLIFIPVVFLPLLSGDSIDIIKNIDLILIFFLPIIFTLVINMYIHLKRKESNNDENIIVDKNELKKLNKEKRNDKINSIEDCIIVINNYIEANINTFKEDLSTIISLLKNFDKKQIYINNIISIKFEPNELIYLKLKAITKSSEEEIISNIEKLLSILWNFDVEEYIIDKNNQMSDMTSSKKKEIFKKYKQLLVNMIKLIDDINLKIDELQLAVSKLIFFSQDNIEKSKIIDLIESIREKMKYYK